MKLGKRLTQIESMVSTDYDHIWDCCCDHGLLGAALLARQAAPHIHFVDIVPELMRELENKLQRFYPTKSTQESHAQWKVHCINVSSLPLHEFRGKHLVIIAGIGGDLMTELVNAIHQQHPTLDIDFLLCPVHHHFRLRQQLIQLDFSLKTEVLIKENQRFYEVIFVSTAMHPDAKINPVGSLIWHSDTPEQATLVSDYLQKTLDHYRRMQLHRHAEAHHIVEAYSAIVL